MCYRLPLQRIIIHETSPYWRTFATVIPSKNASADKKAPKPDPKKGKNSEEGSKKPSSRKVSIIGVGHTGSACAASLIHRRLATEVCLIDQNEKKVKGEKMDLRQIATYFNNVKVYGGTGKGELFFVLLDNLCIFLLPFQTSNKPQTRKLL